MNKKGMSFLSMALVLMCLTVGFAVQQNSGFDIDTFNNNLNWTHIDINVPFQPHLESATESLINGLGEAYMSIAKWAATWSAENPTVPFELLIYLVLFSLFAPLIIVLFKLGVIIFLLIREHFQSKKEKLSNAG